MWEMEDAIELLMGQQIRMDGSRSYNFFRIHVRDPGVLAVVLEGQFSFPYGVSPQLYDATGKRVGTDHGYESGSHHIVRSVIPGTYDLWVPGGRTYAIRSELDPAVGLAAGESRRGFIEHAGDTDVYRIEVGGTGRLVVGTEGDRDTYGRLYDERGEYLTWNDNAGEGDNFRMGHAVTPGTYYAAVTGFGSRGVGEYEVHGEFEPGDDLAGVEVRLSRTFVTVDENGGRGQWTVRLSGDPGRAFVVEVESSNPVVATVDPGRLEFSPLDWNEPRTVTLTGVDDPRPNPSGRIAFITHGVPGAIDGVEVVATVREVPLIVRRSSRGQGGVANLDFVCRGLPDREYVVRRSGDPFREDFILLRTIRLDAEGLGEFSLPAVGPSGFLIMEPVVGTSP